MMDEYENDDNGHNVFCYVTIGRSNALSAVVDEFNAFNPNSFSTIK